MWYENEDLIKYMKTENRMQVINMWLLGLVLLAFAILHTGCAPSLSSTTSGKSASQGPVPGAIGSIQGFRTSTDFSAVVGIGPIIECVNDKGVVTANGGISSQWISGSTVEYWNETLSFTSSATYTISYTRESTSYCSAQKVGMVTVNTSAQTMLMNIQHNSTSSGSDCTVHQTILPTDGSNFTTLDLSQVVKNNAPADVTQSYEAHATDNGIGFLIPGLGVKNDSTSKCYKYYTKQ